MAIKLTDPHVLMQYLRLVRHYRNAVQQEHISLLDFAHTLRVWADMKGSVSDLAAAHGTPAEFVHHEVPGGAKKVMRGGKYIHIPLASGVPSPGLMVKGLFVTNRAMSDAEVKAMYEAGPTRQSTVKRKFPEWLACGILDVPSKREESRSHPQLQISRELLIRRVANIMGASHPPGMKDDDSRENMFDQHVLELHRMKVANGFPATYYQLLEIGKDIIAAFEPLAQKLIPLHYPGKGWPSVVPQPSPPPSGGPPKR